PMLVLVAASSLSAGRQTANMEGAVKGQVHKTPPPVTQKEEGSPFIENLFTNGRGGRMRYLLFVPKNYDQRKRYPLVLWLHGGGSHGEDLKLLLSHGDKHGIGYLARADIQSKYASFIVAPQCPRNKLWGNPGSGQLTGEMKLALEIVAKVRAAYSIDSRRLYVLGMSLGGYGTWDLITRRPGLFAAAVPICGGGDPSKVSLLVKTAVWVFHGDEDELVDVAESRKMIAAIQRAGGKPRYTEYKGVGHNAWERAFAEPELLPWLFAQRLEKR
ncbi:MAG TPA: PHB depolymerase family esterase, partial [Thermoanaerobaculia bacterium]